MNYYEDKKREEEKRLRRGKGMWSYIDRERRKPEPSLQGVHLEELRNHSKILLGGNEEKRESAKQTTATREQEPGEEITTAEVERQMARPEKNNATGVIGRNS
jgi:hypothetical protein